MTTVDEAELLSEDFPLRSLDDEALAFWFIRFRADLDSLVVPPTSSVEDERSVLLVSLDDAPANRHEAEAQHSRWDLLLLILGHDILLLLISAENIEHALAGEGAWRFP